MEESISGFLILLLMSALDICYLKYFEMNNPLPTGFDLINAMQISSFLYTLRNLDGEKNLEDNSTIVSIDGSMFIRGTFKDSTLGSVVDIDLPVQAWSMDTEDIWEEDISVNDGDIADALNYVYWGSRSHEALPFYYGDNNSGITTFTTDFTV
ncbi:unnamed protein product [Somion occarium]|uniref:Uncharacterized protein n=1 Tax=Somion occarium TaxID=3059160 RepID=A0ABP1DCT2_9APHY